MLTSSGFQLRSRGCSLAIVLLGGVAAASIAPAASAQTNTPQAAKAVVPNQLEELIVTARRVEENAQTVPIVITALNAQALHEQAVTNTTEIQFHAPSVQMTTTFGRLSGGFNVRGLPGTTVYYAEFPGGPTQASAALFDIASVQVLNGPQGTLFGRGNTAGAVLISPQKPELGQTGGWVEANVGSLGMNRSTLVFNAPVIKDQLAVRIALHHDHLDGYTKTLVQGVDLNEQNSDNARVSALWRPGDGKFSLYTVFDYYNVDQNPGAYVLSAINPTLTLYNLPANIAAPGGLATGTAVFGAACNASVANGLSSDVSSCIDKRLRIAATFKPTMLAEYARATSGKNALRHVPDSIDLTPRETLTKNSFVADAGYDFGKLGFTTLQVRNIFGFQEARGDTAWSVDGLGGLIQDSVSIGGADYTYTGRGQQTGKEAVFGVGPYQKLYTDETQVRGVIGPDRVRWSAGYFYQSAPFPVNLGGIRNLSRVYSGITLATQGFNPSFNYTNGGYAHQQAGYGQATTDLSFLAPFIRGLHLTTGYRKTWDDQELDQLAVTTNIATGAYVAGAPLAPSKTKSSGTNTELSLDAQITSDLLIYVARRTGYRPGGLNTVTNSAGLPSFTPAYSPELVKDFEAGAKYDFAVGGLRGRVNAGLFKADYTNIQVSYNAAVNGVTATYIVNAAAARIQGAEFQGEVRYGGWDVTGNYSYTDAQYKTFVGPDPLGLIKAGNAACLPPATAAICLLDLSGNPFPFIPKNQGSLNVRYELPLDEAYGRVSLGASAFVQSQRYFGAQVQRVIQAYGEGVRDQISQKPFGRYNLRADWRNVRDTPVSLAVFVNNVTDVAYKISTVTQLHSLGDSVSIYGEPRTYGVEFHYEFGR
jgi:iron complex outermembrane receptor protein